MTTTMKIYGDIAKLCTVTEQDITTTQRDIEAVRRHISRLPDPTCTRQEAIVMITDIRRQRVSDRLHNKALEHADRISRRRGKRHL